MSFFSKIGGFLGKLAPIASIAAPFIPGVGSLISGGLGAVGNWWNAKSADQMGPPMEDGSFSTGGTINGYGGGSTGGYKPPPAGEIPRPGALPTQTVTGSGSGMDWATAGLTAGMGALGLQGQRETNAANAQMADKQMKFQADQSATSWQRGVKDMRAAGLNPMLAYSQGGASSGAGATAQMGSELGAGANSALSASQTMSALRQAAAQTDLTRAQADNYDANTAVQLLGPGKVRAETDNTKSKTAGQILDNMYLERSMESRVSQQTSAASGARLGLSGKRGESSFWEGVNPLLRDGGAMVNSAKGALNNFGATIGNGVYDLTQGVGDVMNKIRTTYGK